VQVRYFQTEVSVYIISCSRLSWLLDIIQVPCSSEVTSLRLPAMPAYGWLGFQGRLSDCTFLLEPTAAAKSYKHPCFVQGNPNASEISASQISPLQSSGGFIPVAFCCNKDSTVFCSTRTDYSQASAYEVLLQTF
jgi:hypothetical protein